MHLNLLHNPRAWLSASVAGAVLAVAGCGGGDDDATVAPSVQCTQQVNDTEAKLLACVTLDGVKAHLGEFDKIARANDGNRAAGLPGYEASVAYAEKVFGDAGYTVARKTFDFIAFTNLGGSVLQQVAPLPRAEIVHAVMGYSGAGAGDVASAPVTVVANLGCDTADFAGFTAGSVALIKRGICAFTVKANNAVAAGAAGVVIYNDIAGAVVGSLGEEFTANVPVLEVTQAVGQQLAAVPGLRLHLKATTTRNTKTTFNVIAESKGGDADHVVMVGAHLDSVDTGPGINDNGSGSAAILETAVQLAKVTPKYKLRFALWGGEEAGLLGSTNYVGNLAEEERAKIALYLNFDMIASPNAGYFIYDGDNSDGTGEGPGPDGSAAIEKTFEALYTARAKAFKGTDFDGRSDYGPFIEHGIPAGGVYSGAEDIKSAEEAALWGGTAGVAYDKCYHAACDDLANLDLAVLDLNSDVVAAATLHYANSLDGVRAVGTAARMKTQSTGAKAYLPPADMRPKHLPVLK